MRRQLLRLAVVALAMLAFSTSGGVVEPIVAIAGARDSVDHHVLTAADSAAALHGLANDISALVDLDPEVASHDVGIVVRSLSSGATVFALNPTAQLTPASTTKMVTVFTALNELGPRHTIRTIAATEREPKDGVVPGDLYVKGYGDPYLSIGDIDDLVDGIVRRGIRRIDGDVVGDGTYFDMRYDRTEYSGDHDEVEDLPPISALSIESNIFTVLISSPRTPGQPLNVQTHPRSSGFEIINTGTSAAVKTSHRSRRRSHRHSDVLMPGRPRVERLGDEPVTVRTVSNASGPQVSVSGARDGQQKITVSGTLAPGRRVSYRYKMANPPLVVAGMIYDRLQARGVRIGGGAVWGPTPEHHFEIAVHERPFSEVLERVLKHSHNYSAEYVFKMIGAKEGGQERTASTALRTISDVMSRDGISYDACRINDGSGLSRNNTLSATCSGRHSRVGTQAAGALRYALQRNVDCRRRRNAAEANAWHRCPEQSPGKDRDASKRRRALRLRHLARRRSVRLRNADERKSAVDLSCGPGPHRRAACELRIFVRAVAAACGPQLVIQRRVGPPRVRLRSSVVDRDDAIPWRTLQQNRERTNAAQQRRRASNQTSGASAAHAR